MKSCVHVMVCRLMQPTVIASRAATVKSRLDGQCASRMRERIERAGKLPNLNHNVVRPCQTLPGLPRAARPSGRFAEGKTPLL